MSGRRVGAALCVALAASAGLAGGCTTGRTEPAVLRVVASPELADMRPVLADLRRETGVEVVLDLRPGLDTAPLPSGDQGYDAAWFTTDAYLRLRNAEQPAARPLSTVVMRSPVVIGVRPRVADALRQAAGGAAVTWADVADAAATGTVRLAMADPRQGGSALAALVGVATAAAGTGAALRPQDVACDRLRGFFAGQQLTAPSFTQLAEQYVERQDGLDALIGEEAALLALNDSGRLRDPLEIIYPADGIMQADYPLALLNPARRAAYDKVLGWLTSRPVQQRITERTLRRPLDAAVPRDARLRLSAGATLYFPNELAVLDTLLAHYVDPRLRRPDQVLFVLDFSGSMRGERIAALRATFAGLSGADRSSSGKFFRFARGETFTVIRFGGRILDEREFTVEDQQDLDDLGRFIATDDFDQRTAVWSALEHAYTRAAAVAGDRSVAVVLMTDGVSNAGIGIEEFLARRTGPAAPAATAGIPTFAIRYGEADAVQLDRAARATGGRMVDAGAVPLLEAFKEIRGCD